MNMKLALAISLSLVACKKDDKAAPPPSSSSSEKAAEAAPASTKEKESGPFAGWDMEARRKAWQGAWVTTGGSLGAWEAWDVKGDKVTVWDGTAEKTLEFELLSPCEVQTTEKSPDGSSSGTISHYTLKDGVIVKGLGDAGTRRGNEAIACVSNKVVTLAADGKCTEWERSMFGDGKYESAPGTCRLEGDKFFATINGYESELKVVGDAILSDQLANVHGEKAADFNAAKAARDAKK